MPETTDTTVVTELPEHQPRWFARNKTRIAKVAVATTALGAAFVLGRRTNSDDCSCENDDTAGTDTSSDS